MAAAFTSYAIFFVLCYLFLPLSPNQLVDGQRLSTRPLLQSYYLFSHESPYSSQFNFFGAYQYCRSIGMALVSFESVEEVETIHEYLRNTSADKQEYWTSGNILATKDREFVQWIWMSTGVQYNATLARFWSGSGANSYSQNVQGRQSFLSSGDPNGQAPFGNQDCMGLAPGPVFQGSSCERRLQYICESAQYYFLNQRPVINKGYSRTLSGFSQRQIIIQDVSGSSSLPSSAREGDAVNGSRLSADLPIRPSSKQSFRFEFVAPAADAVSSDHVPHTAFNNNDASSVVGRRESGKLGPVPTNDPSGGFVIPDGNDDGSGVAPLPATSKDGADVSASSSSSDPTSGPARFHAASRTILFPEARAAAHEVVSADDRHQHFRRRQNFNLTFQIRAPPSLFDRESFVISPSGEAPPPPATEIQPPPRDERRLSWTDDGDYRAGTRFDGGEDDTSNYILVVDSRRTSAWR